MKIYETTSELDVTTEQTLKFREFTSSAGDASKVRTRLKKAKHEEIKTVEIDIDTTRTGVIKFLNERLAEPGWAVEPVAAKLGA